ncbi:hypothetical protein PF005_g23041 [Phytophthora fragariae]|uniref:Secreted protein n=1 Tax=Phytophthora fragariae TaxID=53985 RepID=A0A6A3IMI7_9STRA|nr:hypothetical protein PF003_g11544 [Phytophthora fragariae]KAE8926087.1 hypothetical protein PF009_g23714 [Phytophthora fragariae]KAE8981908.1 hypothetical protein PF011_g21841 [Phytophthora fragariae]KAE9079979.1 hypothetical protein PF010_g22563 [Phytophthora fragariae]KAE9080102.1 hypothetical protein PF007_g23181 [Phytophthora fragariae]
MQVSLVYCFSSLVSAITSCASSSCADRCRMPCYTRAPLHWCFYNKTRNSRSNAPCHAR